MKSISNNMKMDIIDRNILNIIQSDFPVCMNPYKDVAKKLGITETEVVNRVKQLKKFGIIRRIGASFDSRKMGFTSTLCAACVPDEKLKLFIEKVNSFPGVTHNYLRDHKINIWFTFIGKSSEEIKKVLTEIKEETGIAKIYNFPAIKMFKIKVDFAM